MDVRNMFMQIHREKYKLALLNSVVNMIFTFLVLHIFLSIFSVKPYVAAIISIITMPINMRHYMRKYSIDAIEGKNPEIREMLKTAKDNIRENNIVAQMFFRDVVDKVRHVYVGSLVSMKKLNVKMVAIVILTMAIVFAPADGGVKIDLNQIAGILDLSKINFDLGGIAFQDPDDILGDPRLVDLGNKELQINIRPSNNEIDFSKPLEEERKEFARNQFPVDVGAVADTPSNEAIPEEYDLIKAYNLKIR
ncbi:MAG: hypothetical protein HY518_02715 [Candidatus Aenigmarchaeota archaeon]|nr:hypothetical protein [Candidatus Aenigmarchaeota archaeon]